MKICIWEHSTPFFEDNDWHWLKRSLHYKPLLLHIYTLPLMFFFNGSVFSAALSNDCNALFPFFPHQFTFFFMSSYVLVYYSLLVAKTSLSYYLCCYHILRLLDWKKKKRIKEKVSQYWSEIKTYSLRTEKQWTENIENRLLKSSTEIGEDKQPHTNINRECNYIR